MVGTADHALAAQPQLAAENNQGMRGTATVGSGVLGEWAGGEAMGVAASKERPGLNLRDINWGIAAASANGLIKLAPPARSRHAEAQRPAHSAEACTAATTSAPQVAGGSWLITSTECRTCKQQAKSKKTVGLAAGVTCAGSRRSGDRLCPWFGRRGVQPQAALPEELQRQPWLGEKSATSSEVRARRAMRRAAHLALCCYARCALADGGDDGVPPGPVDVAHIDLKQGFPGH